MHEQDKTERDEQPKPGASRVWLERIESAGKAFEVWQSKCDNIDKLYASLEKQADVSGDREFQIFWANLEVLKPTVYERPPRPVVMPRHSDGGEVQRVASELVERVLEMDVDEDDLHDTLILARDDLALSARGVIWVLDDGKAVHVERQDFRHEPARKWQEVSWVARRAYLTLEEGVKRFGEAFMSAKREKVETDDQKDYESSQKKAQVWEIWDKTTQKVVWVTKGVEDVLDESEPMINVKGFFPCPRPAYGTLEKSTLKPVPDFVYYRDQVDEINELTARISKLSESLRMRGFYASGASEVGEAIEAAMKVTDNNSVLVPVSNFAALGGAGLKDSIVWLPVQEVAEVIAQLIMLRRQLIEDVYEITGLSDIMRGTTEASETLGAQQLKAQYGNVRVRGRQGEMVRLARDILRIKGEIFAEEYSGQDLMTMAGKQIANQADLENAMIEYQKAVVMAQQAGEQPPEQPDFEGVVTIEAVEALLKDQRLRPFLLEIESDSTIAADEQAEKQSRIEFITAVGGFIQQAGAMVAAQPETAPFAAEMLKFAAGGFRAGRDLAGAIDDFAKQVTEKAEMATQAPNPAQMEAEMKAQEAQAKLGIEDRKVKIDEARLQLDAQKTQAEMVKGEPAQDNRADLARLENDRQKMILDKQAKDADREMSAQIKREEILAGLEVEKAKIIAQSAAQPAAEGERGNDVGQSEALKVIEGLMQTVQAQIEVANAPKEVVRDEQGRVAGVRPVMQ